jgi:hypothetical protein
MSLFSVGLKFENLFAQDLKFRMFCVAVGIFGFVFRSARIKRKRIFLHIVCLNSEELGLIVRGFNRMCVESTSPDLRNILKNFQFLVGLMSLK